MLKILCTTALLLQLGCASLEQGTPVGVVTRVAGLPEIGRDGARYLADEQSRVRLGDVLETDTRSRMRVILDDGTSIELGGDARLVLKRYQPRRGLLAPRTTVTWNTGSVDLRSGATSRGWRSRFEMVTPLATLRMREARLLGEIIERPRVVHVGMRGEDSLLRVDFAAPVGLVGFGEVRLRHEPVAEHAARLQVFPKDVHHATLPEAVAGDGQGGSVMHAQRVPRRCSGRYAVGALPRLEGPAAVSSSAGWGARVSSAVPRGRAGKGRLPDVLSRRSVNIDHHHVDRESTCDRSGRGGRF